MSEQVTEVNSALIEMMTDMLPPIRKPLIFRSQMADIALHKVSFVKTEYKKHDRLILSVGVDGISIKLMDDEAMRFLGCWDQYCRGASVVGLMPEQDER